MIANISFEAVAWWRIVTMFQAGFAAALAFYIAAVYFCTKSDRDPHEERIMRSHIILMAVSYMLLTLLATVDLVAQFKLESPLSFKLPIRCIAFTCGDISLMLLLGYSYRKFQRYK